MSSQAVPNFVVKARTTAAQSMRANLNLMCSHVTFAFVVSFADALGCPVEFIFFPLLATVANFMGVNTKLSINRYWKEPAILWVVVCARKGELKSPAGRVIKAGISAVEKLVHEEHRKNNPAASDDELPRLTVTHFSFERLHSLMKQNNGTVMGFFDEMTLLYDAIRYAKGKSNVDRKNFLSLNGGDPWERDFQSGSSVVPETCLNIVGFIQPKYAIEMLSHDDADGFMDRQLFACPVERKEYPDEVQDRAEHLPEMEDVLALVYKEHQHKSEYTLSQDSRIVAMDYIRELVDRKEVVPDDENRRGILAKARGQFLRIPMVLQVMERAISKAARNLSDLQDDWCDRNISEQSVLRARQVMDYFIEQKFRLMPPEVKTGVEIIPSTPTSSENGSTYSYDDLEENGGHNVKSLLTCGLEQVSASFVAQRHLMPPTHTPNTQNKYKTEAAIAYLHKVSDLGFGNIERRGKSTYFNKRTFDSLSEISVNLLHKFQISEKLYKKQKADG